MSLQFISNLYLTPFVLRMLESLAKAKCRAHINLQAQQTKVPQKPEGEARKQKYIQKYKKEVSDT